MSDSYKNSNGTMHYTNGAGQAVTVHTKVSTNTSTGTSHHNAYCKSVPGSKMSWNSSGPSNGYNYSGGGHHCNKKGTKNVSW